MPQGNLIREACERELRRRLRKNARYSLRNFAKSLGVSPSFLSLFLANKRNISKVTAAKLVDRLSLPTADRKQLLQESHDKEPCHTAKKLELDTYELISHWQHFAVLSLLDLPNACFDAKWIAKSLMISETQARASMKLLTDLELVGKVDGAMKQKCPPIKVENTISTAATRKFHHVLLERAQFSLENDPMDARDFCSNTFVMDEKWLPYAKEEIRKFRRRLADKLETAGNANRVFTLAVQIFPLSH